MPYLGGVADGQRLGMKMKLPCNRTFAAPAKLVTSRVINGNLLVRRGAGRQWNDKVALRMNFGMRVLGGLFAALIMFAIPVARLSVLLVPSVAAALLRSLLQVRGTRRF